MIRIIFILFITQFIFINSYASYIEIICNADSEWKSLMGKKEKIWIKFNKPKYIFHLDEDNMKIIKMGFSKDTSEVSSVDANIEIKSEGENTDSYRFYTSADLSIGESVINEFSLLSFNDISLNNRFGLFMEQYRLHPEQLILIGKEMQNDKFSELQRARREISKDTSYKYKRIEYFGGQEGLCEASFIKS